MRFVILIHDHPTLHWDFLLEVGPACRTWRLKTSPDSFLTEESHLVEITAEAIVDHRLEYLNYEGPVSGNRGNVVRWDVGTMEILAEDAASVRVYLHGVKLNGVAVLSRRQKDDWSMIFEFRDDMARERVAS